MGDCKYLPKCLFFNDRLKSMPQASDALKNLYCKWNYKKCARFKIAIVFGPSALPDDLFPGDQGRAQQMLIQGDKK